MVLKKFPTDENQSPKIFYSGVFDYAKLVKTIAQWYAEQGYEFHEDVYKHKVPSPAGYEQELKLKGWRKVTEYVQFWIMVYTHAWEVKEIDVMIDGEKKRMVKGKIMIRFSIDCWLDYNQKFNTPAAVKIQDFLHNHIWLKKISGGWTDELYYMMYKLHKVCKETLNMSTPTNASEIRY